MQREKNIEKTHGNLRFSIIITGWNRIMNLLELKWKANSNRKAVCGNIKYMKPFFSKEKENILIYPEEILLLNTSKGNYFIGEQKKEYKLIYSTDGEGRIEYKGKEYKLEKGEGCFIDCRNVYKCITTQIKWEHVVLTLSGKMVSAIYQEYEKSGIIFSSSEYPDFEDRLYYIMKKLVTKRNLSCFDVSCHLNHFLTKLLFSVQNNKRRNEAEKSLIMKVVSYMQDNFQKNIKIQQLADYFNFSPSYFRKLFREEMNMSPKEYFSYLRLKFAKEELKNTSKNIAVISEEAGFQSPEYFSQVFKQITGVTATEYRKTQKAENP